MNRLSLYRKIVAALFLCLSPGIAHAGDGLLDGLVEPSEVVAVSSQVPGILDRVDVERGDVVQQGQVLARLKSAVEEAAVESARARVEFGRRKVVRNEELFQKQLLSRHEKDELETEVQLAELELQEALERLQLRTIISSVQGVVVSRELAPGEYVGDGAILTLARIDPLYAEVIAPVERWGLIQKGMTAEVYPEAPVGGKYLGTTIVVDQVIDAGSGTFGVRVELPNPDYRLPAGMKCKVRFVEP